MINKRPDTPRVYLSLAVRVLILSIPVILILIWWPEFDSIKTDLANKVQEKHEELITQRVEIQVLSNQAVSDIETQKNASIAEIENVVQESINQTKATEDDKVVSKEILNALNAARKETHK